jgi:serine/threonine-protein kinase
MTELVLPRDVQLVPVADLAPEVSARFEWSPGDVAITRAYTRTPSRVVDARGAALLARFREPRRLADVIIEYSAETGEHPERVLDAAIPLLERLTRARVLVPPDHEAAVPITHSLAEREVFAGHEVLRRVRLMEDVEIYQVRDVWGDVRALKLARDGAGAAVERALAHEATILRALGGGVAPRLREAGTARGRPYLATEWCPGVDVATAARELRAEPGSRSALRALLIDVAGAFAALHARGVLHGDVHPGNVLVHRDGGVRVIDFGLACLTDAGTAAERGAARVPRGGVPFYYPPSYAAALLAGTPPPPLTAADDLYALAAMLFLLATGGHARDYSLERDAMLRQIVETPPRTFADVGARPWPELEAALGVALRPAPADRFATVDDLVCALAAVPDEASRGASTARTTVSDAGRALLADYTERARREAEAPTTLGVRAPTGSVTFGAAGIAFFLYRLAMQRGDGDLLAHADLWAARTDHGGRSAWYSDDMDLTRHSVGTNGLYHTAAGARCVQALVAAARGDGRGTAEAVSAFVAASDTPTAFLDVTLGRAGTLLGCALLAEALGAAAPPALLAFGDRVAAQVADVLARCPRGFVLPLPDDYPVVDETKPSLAEAPLIGYVGVAHGEAGLLYALLRWSGVVGRPAGPEVEGRLTRLAADAVPRGRGAAWPSRKMPTVPGESVAAVAGWCNGSAGMLHLWTLAHRHFGRPEYAAAAEGAAWHAWESAGPPGDLCCGAAGRAYALLNFNRHSGDARWLARAQRLATVATEAEASAFLAPESLYRGRVGVALLVAELDDPLGARMPLFEHEGWPGRP